MIQMMRTSLALSVLLATFNCCLCANKTITIKSLTPSTKCDTSVVKLGSLDVIKNGAQIVGLGGTLQLLSAITEDYFVGVSYRKIGESAQTYNETRQVCLWLIDDARMAKLEIDPPPPKSCPIAAGSYTLKGVRFDGGLYNYYDGSYEVLVSLEKQGNPVCGLNLQIEVGSGNSDAKATK